MIDYSTKKTKSEIRQSIRTLKRWYFDLLWDNVNTDIFYKCLMSDYLKTNRTKTQLIAFYNNLESSILKVSRKK